MNISTPMSDWASVFKEGLKYKYPQSQILPYEIEALRVTDSSNQIIFKSLACIASVMALVEYNQEGELVFLKFYTVALFNDLAAIGVINKIECGSSNLQ